MKYSAKHQVVVYQVANPAQVAAAIEGARPLNGHSVAVPATLFSLQLARVLGLPTPPLLDSAYDWPGQFTPFAHQRHMANFHALHPKCFNLSDMGTGKTLGCLWAADYLMREGVIKKALVLSPLSTLRSVWENEVFKHFLGRRRATIVYGDRAKRLSILADRKPDFYILNHDGLTIGSKRAYGHRGLGLGPIAQAVADRPDIDLVIVDEASAYKDRTTLRTQVLRGTVASKPYLWLLSGTPTPNAPTDAWSLARIVQGSMTESFVSFQSRTMTKLTTFKWAPKPDAADAVSKLLSPGIRYNRDECLDLPPLVVETREVPLSDTQKKAYDTLKKELALTLKDGKQVTAFNEAVLRLKLIQVAAGAVYGPDREVHRTDCGPRLDELRSVLDEVGIAKVLVFAPLTSVVNLLYSELKSWLGERAVARIYGATPHGQRAQILRQFQEEKDPRVIVADPGTMAHGITATAANAIVWFAPVDKPEVYEQANARINRPGQTRSMLVVRLVSTPVERAIFHRLHEKASLQGAILGLVEEGR